MHRQSAQVQGQAGPSRQDDPNGYFHHNGDIVNYDDRYQVQYYNLDYLQDLNQENSTITTAYQLVSKLSALRASNDALGYGTSQQRWINNDVYIFERQFYNDVVLVAINKNDTTGYSITGLNTALPAGTYTDYLGGLLSGGEPDGYERVRRQQSGDGIYAWAVNGCCLAEAGKRDHARGRQYRTVRGAAWHDGHGRGRRIWDRYRQRAVRNQPQLPLKAGPTAL
jgi:Alpha amylase, C-terminal all-beta domain